MKTALRAFSLVEVTVALGIAAFCLVAIFGLIPAGLNTNKASIQQNVAANLASLIASDLRATPETTNKSTAYGVDLPAGGTGTKSVCLDESGAATNAVAANFLATVTVVSPTSGVTASSARILITWPAAADISKASGSFETVIGLDRN